MFISSTLRLLFLFYHAASEVRHLEPGEVIPGNEVACLLRLKHDKEFFDDEKKESYVIRCICSSSPIYTDFSCEGQSCSLN